MSSNAAISNLSSQNIAAGGGDQLNQNGNGTQINNSTFYGVNFQTPQTETADRTRTEREACLRSLMFRTIDSRRYDIAHAHPNTCDWLFDTPEFQEWRNPAALPAHNGVLWIKGKPGSGKSTLMKHAYVRYQRDFFSDHTIAAYFFNARGERLEKTPLGMLRSIVYQLLEADPIIYNGSASIFRYKYRLHQEGDWQWRQSELKEIVRSAVRQPRLQPILLLVDALDECEESEVRDLVEFFDSLSTHAFLENVPLKICLSSRHYPSIKMGTALELTVEKSADHQRDIDRYLRGKLRTRDAYIESKILEMAEGIFLWVVIVVSLLNKAYDEGRVEAMRSTLDVIPSDLEDVFSRILNQDASDASETVLMLQWMLLSLRPLKPEELFAAVVRTPPPTKDLIQRRITTSSKGLIEVRKGEEFLQFIHLSVGDFLFRRRRLQTLDPTLGPDPIAASHGRLWARCWSCIKQVCTMSTSENNMRELNSRYPFLEYAARHILHHAEKALSKDVRIRNGHDHWMCERGYSDSSNNSQRRSIQQWLQGPDNWFLWWKIHLFVNTTDSFERSERQSEVHAGLVYILARRGLPNLLRAILKGANVNAKGGYYGNALQAASVKGNQEIVRLLLEEGADVHAKGGEYGNILQAASIRGNQEIVKLLLEKGADIHARGGYYDNALQAAIIGGNQEIARILLDQGADVNAKCSYEYGDALQTASIRGNEEIVRLLLEKGADIHAQGGFYGDALRAASFEGHNKIVRLLLSNGADINAQIDDKRSALQMAHDEGNQEVVELLLEEGADVSAQSRWGWGSALTTRFAPGIPRNRTNAPRKRCRRQRATRPARHRATGHYNKIKKNQKKKKKP